MRALGNSAKTPRKQTRAEQITAGVVRSHRDFSTADLNNRCMTVTATIHDDEAEIARLRAELSRYSARLVADQAEYAGLMYILDGVSKIV